MSDTNSIGVWIFLGITAIGLGYCLYSLNRLSLRFKNAFGSLDSKQDLAKTISEYFNKVSSTHQKLDNLQRSYNHLAAIGTRSIQKIGMVRFNPFRDTGGDQSFVLALLDNHDSGFLMTSIHGREGTRIYVKPVEYGSSKYAFSEEEKGALKAAQIATKRGAHSSNGPTK